MVNNNVSCDCDCDCDLFALNNHSNHYKAAAQLMSWLAMQHCCTYNCRLTNYTKRNLDKTNSTTINLVLT